MDKKEMHMEQNTITLSREQLLVITSAIILSGIAANYSTVSPSTHSTIAMSLARELMGDFLK